MNKKIQIKAKSIKKQFIILFSILLFVGNGAYANRRTMVELSAKETMQQKKITLNVQNKSLKYILTEFGKVSGLSFMIEKNVEEGDSDNLSIHVEDVTVESALNTLLAKTNFTFKVVDNIITILKKESISKPQKIAVTGFVIDAKKEPIVGATVIVQGTPIGAITDTNGAFSFTAEPNATLEISFIGKKTSLVTIGTKAAPLTIVMEEDAMAVDDVVVTGIFNKSTKSFTGSAVTISDKELKQYGNRNVLTSLRNIDPSFNIVENNSWGSNPNKLPEVQIRGNSSLPNVGELKDEARVDMNTPLVILDGFESTLQALIDMNENDVASITLLKDASATALYGSRGANGVVVITTKAPIAGKLKISYRGDLNIELPDITSYSLLDAREKLDLEYQVGKFTGSSAEYEPGLKKYYNYLLNEVNSGVNTDWLAKPLRVGVGHKHNLRIEGGDETFRYAASAQYNSTQGVMKGSSRDNFNGSITLTYNYKNVKFTNNLIIGINKSVQSPYGSFDQYVTKNPYFRTHDDDGNVLKMLGQYGYGETNSRYASDHPTLKNPLYDATLNTMNDKRTTSLKNNFSAEWTIFDGLILRARFGISQIDGEGDVFFPAEHTMFSEYNADEMIMRRGKYDKSNDKSFNYDGSLNLSYSKLIAEKHLLYAGIDYNMREDKGSMYNVTAEGFTNSQMNFFPMALQYQKDGKPSGSETLARSVGVTGTINYTYDNRYYADISGRIDGSSAFGSKNRFAPFWSVGLGWNLHREKFLKDSKVINLLKVRGSAGITGSQNFNPYQALSTYKYYTDDRYYSWMGSYLMGLGNENLKWQQKMNYNFGVDMRILDERVMLNFDYYIEETKDLISSVNIPLTQGFPSYTENIGAMKNRGLELKLTVIPIKNENWLWSVTGGMIHNKNEITKISQALKDAQGELESDKSANPNTLYREGYSTNSIWVVPSLGIDSGTGKEVFMDRFNNVTHIWDARDLAYCGLDGPKFQGNLNTMLRYKNISLTMSFGYRFGGQIYNSTLINKVENANYDYNVDSRVYTDRWKKPGDKSFFKGINVLEPTNKTSRFVQNENTFNCQNVNLSYEFYSEKLTKKLGVQYLTISANVADLFYISTVKRERGTEYPFSRQASMTLSVTF